MDEIYRNLSEILNMQNSEMLNAVTSCQKMIASETVGILCRSMEKVILPQLKIFTDKQYSIMMDSMKTALLSYTDLCGNKEIFKNALGLVNFSKMLSSVLPDVAEYQKMLINQQNLMKIVRDAGAELRTSFNSEKILGNIETGIDSQKLYNFVKKYETKLVEDIPEDSLTVEQQKDVEECLRIDLENGNCDGFQARMHDWVEKQKRQYYLAYRIVLVFLTLFVAPYFTQEVAIPFMTKAVSCVRKLPDKASGIIDKIEEGVEGIVTDDVPYWVEVTWEENGIKKKGWIAKKNIQYKETTVDDLNKENDE